MINDILQEFQDITGIHCLPNSPELTSSKIHHSVPRSLPETPISQPIPPRNDLTPQSPFFLKKYQVRALTLSISLSLSLSLSLSVFLYSLCLCICLFFYFSLSLSLSLSVIYLLSICFSLFSLLSLSSFVSVSLSLSFCLPICLSLSLIIKNKITIQFPHGIGLVQA